YNPFISFPLKSFQFPPSKVKEGGYTSCACLKKNDGYNIQTTAHAKLNFHHGLVQPQALLDFARHSLQSLMITIQMKDKPRAIRTNFCLEQLHLLVYSLNSN
ncbi:unnamed protein product, partial [Brassica rapa]